MTSTGTAWRRAAFAALGLVAFALAAQADDPPPAGSPPPAPPADAATPPANAAPIQIGRSILVVNQVDGQYGDAPAQHLKINDDIVFSEDITTGADAKTVIEFRDGSTFEIGADAVVRIDSFIFNPEESTSHKAVQVTRGVFRYVSGYVASDQDTKITTPAGEMGIRGSVVEGIVDPSVPDFVYVSEGNATFTNGAGSSDLAAGNAIAVPSATTAPMAATAMPPAVVAQAVQVIQRRLPPRASFEGRLADDAWLKRTGAINLTPAADQHRLQTAVPARPLPTLPPRGSLAGELGLLVEGNRVNLFHGGQGPRTPEQTAFVARAVHDNPRAGVLLQQHQLQAQAFHRTSVTAGTALVIRGVAHAAPPADVMHRITDASVKANPGAAAAINRHVTETYHGPTRGDPTHPGGTILPHPQEHVVPPHTPPGNQPFHGNPPNPATHSPIPQNNLGPRPPQQQNITPQTPQQPHGFVPGAPQQQNVTPQTQQPRGFVPGAPQQQQPRGFVPGAPQQQNVTPQTPQPPRGFVPGAQPQPPRGFVPGTPQPPRGFVPGAPQQQNVTPQTPQPPRGFIPRPQQQQQPQPPGGTPKPPPKKKEPDKKEPDKKDPQTPR